MEDTSLDNSRPSPSTRPEQETSFAGTCRVASHVTHRWIVTPGVATVLFGFYLLTVPGNRSDADDAYMYASIIERGTAPALVDPLHLLYMPVMRLVMVSAQSLGLNVGVISVAALLGAACAAGTIIAFYHVLRRGVDLPHVRALVPACGLAVSYGFWRYAAEIEVYSLAVLCMVGLLLAIFTASPSTRSLVGLVVLATLAVCAHILNAVPVLLIGPYILYRRFDARRAITYILATGTCLFFVTLGAYYFGLQDPMSRATESGTYFGFYLGAGDSDFSVRPAVIARLVVAFGQTIASGNFLFSYGAVQRALTAVAPTQNLADERLMGELTPPVLTALATATMAALLLVAVVVFVIAWRRAMWEHPTTALIACWLLGNVAINVYTGSVVQPEVWLLSLVPLWMFIAKMTATVPLRPLLAVIVLLLVHNALGGVGPLHNERSDRNVVLGSWLVAHADKHDLIVTADSAGLARYVAYESGASVIYLPAVEPDSIERWAELLATRDPNALASVAAGTTAWYPPGRYTSPAGRLFVTGDVFAPPDYIANVLPARAAAIRTHMGPLRSSYTEVFDGDLPVYLRDDAGGMGAGDGRTDGLRVSAEAQRGP